MTSQSLLRHKQQQPWRRLSNQHLHKQSKWQRWQQHQQQALKQTAGQSQQLLLRPAGQSRGRSQSTQLQLLLLLFWVAQQLLTKLSLTQQASFWAGPAEWRRVLLDTGLPLTVPKGELFVYASLCQLQHCCQAGPSGCDTQQRKVMEQAKSTSSRRVASAVHFADHTSTDERCWLDTSLLQAQVIRTAG